MNLRGKLFYAFISLIIIPLIVLGGVTFYLSSQLMDNKYAEQTQLTLQALSRSIEYALEDMNNVSDTWIANYYLQSILMPGPYADGVADDPLKLVLDERNFRRVLVNHPAITYALLYSQNGSIIQLQSKNDFTPMPFAKLREHPIYREIVKRDGVPLWLGPHEYPEITGNNPGFTQIRVVNDLNTLQSRGVLFIQVKLSKIEALFREFGYSPDDRDRRFFLIGRNGLILFDSKQSIDGSVLPENVNSRIEEPKEFVHFKAELFGEQSVVSSYAVGADGWKLVSVTSWNSLSKEMVVIARWVFGILIVCLASALLFNLVFVNRVARSIVRILRFMKRVESGDLQVRVSEKGKDELGLLAKGFNSLVGKVGRLIEEVRVEQQRQKHAELILLQAQIKPHFLFNTLESINALAVQNEGRKVSQMVTRLGRMLRISIQQREEITLREELLHLRYYLDIQAFRFEDLFTYDLDVHESLMEFGILKMTLQPLVENSIQHGFDGLERHGRIVVRAEDLGSSIAIFIEDNGHGIPKSVLRRFQEPGGGEPEISSRSGLGIRNVADRLRIEYGKEYGLCICSSDEGTVIRCVVPKRKPGDERHDQNAAG